MYEDDFYDDDDVDVVQDVAENAEEDVIGNANAMELLMLCGMTM
jgi:hypothetical protein